MVTLSKPLLRKSTFSSDNEMNDFFNRVQCRIVKFIIFVNPISRAKEYHLIWSTDQKLKNGMHLDTGHPCVGRPDNIPNRADEVLQENLMRIGGEKTPYTPTSAEHAQRKHFDP